MVKSSEEIELLKKSADITEEAFLSSVNILKSNKIFGDAREEYRQALEALDIKVHNYNKTFNYYYVDLASFKFAEIAKLYWIKELKKELCRWKYPRRLHWARH